MVCYSERSCIREVLKMQTLHLCLNLGTPISCMVTIGQSTTVKSLTVVKLNNGQWRGGTCAPGRPCFWVSNWQHNDEAPGSVPGSIVSTTCTIQIMQCKTVVHNCLPSHHTFKMLSNSAPLTMSAVQNCIVLMLHKSINLLNSLEN